MWLSLINKSSREDRRIAAALRLLPERGRIYVECSSVCSSEFNVKCV